LQITTGPSDQKVKEDEVVNFFCRISGSPSAEISWYHAGKRISPKNQRAYLIVPVASGSVLRIELAKPRRDDGTFECRAENGIGGSASATATLEVYPLGRVPPGYPDIILNPEVTSVEKNHNTALGCVGKGSPDVTVSWLHDYVPVDLSNPRYKLLPSGSLQILDSIESDDGKYECAVENSVGTKYSYRVHLYVRIRRVSPYFSIPPEDVEVVPGGHANLTCVAVGSPMPYVKWRLGAKELTPDNNTPIGKNVLVLHNIHESATYTCVASSPLGNIEGHAAVKVKALPQAPVNIVASEITSQSVKLHWTLDNVDPIDSYVIQYKKKSDLTDDYSELADITRQDHIITGLMSYTVYEFQVLAANSIGKSLPSAAVEVLTKESTPGSAPSNIRARPVSSTSIVVQWDEPKQANGVIKRYTIYYTLIPELSLPSWTQLHRDSNEPTSINDLMTNQTYSIAMMASTVEGDGPVSEYVQVKTQQGVPEQPLNLHSEAVSDTVIGLAWDPPATSSDLIESYEVYYSGAERSIHVTVSPPKNSYVLSNLIPNTPYSIQVSATSSHGEGARTAPILVKTIEAAPSGSPLNVQGEAIDSTTLRITWSAPSIDQQNGVIAGYRLYYAVAAHSQQTDSSAVIMTTPASEPFIVLRGLQKWTQYKVWVRAYTRSGDGPASVAIIAQTAEDLPGEPRQVRLRALNSTAISVRWSPPMDKEQNGVIRGYQIYYSVFDEKEGAEKLSVIDMSDSQTETIISSLKPDTQYQVQIAAYNRKGDGMRSRMRKIKTKATKGLTLGAPRQLNLETIAESPPVVRLTWQAPRGSEALQLEYRVEWGIHGKTEVETGDTIKTSFTTDALEYGVEYEFRVSAKSQQGFGEEAVNSVTTPEGVPTATPDNVTADSVTLTSARLTWSPLPLTSRSGVIVRYDIRYSLSVHYGAPQVASTASAWKVIEDLLPGRMYVFQVAACTTVGCSPWSPEAKFTTASQDNADPVNSGDTTLQTSESQAIKNLQAEAKSPTSVKLQWNAPPEGDVAFYRVTYEGSYIHSLKRSAISVRGEQNVSSSETSVVLNDLLNNHTYTFNITARFMNDVWGPTTSIRKRISDDLPTNKEFMAEKAEPSELASVKLLLILAPVCGGIVAILLVILIIVYIRRKKAVKSMALPQRKSLLTPAPMDTGFDTQDPVDLHRFNYQSQAMQSHPPILVSDLAKHIARLKANEKQLFAQEFESIESGQTFQWEASMKQGNVEKNRYANVVAYDHSRVVLQNMVDGSDYINANYMDGYCKPGAYIATQGPMPSTFAEFWQMVWEQHCPTIVMMTKLEERNRIKCDLYWPNHGTETYGNVQVTIVNIFELATYTTRIFQITMGNTGEIRKVYQFQFTAWPDHGVPDHPTPLLQFIRRVKNLTNPQLGPIVVHCSAGVGRTGAYIAIDAMLDRIQHEKTIDVYCQVTYMRAQRNYMVQTEDQYIFIHEALLEAVESGDSEVPAELLFLHVQRLTHIDPTTGTTPVELEFNKLGANKVDTTQLISALLPVNKPKNRLMTVLPYESTRVRLQMIRGVEGSDYINANYIDGYQQKRAYIATQGPMESTTDDFWQMLWENNCTVVVMLINLFELGQEKCHQYWPENRLEKYKFLVVEPLNTYDGTLYICREFKVTDARDGQSRILRQFHFTQWPEQGVPNSGEGFIEFIGQVQKVRDEYGQDGPITVHCSMGIGRTGVFIALSIVLERMKGEGLIDMYQTVNMLRTQRPGMVQHEDQYVFCHRAALEYLSSFDYVGVSHGQSVLA